MEHFLTDAVLEQFRRQLEADDRAPATVEKYLRDLRAFGRWLGGRAVSKETVSAWKDALVASGYQITTVNGKLSALDRFFAAVGWQDARVKHLKCQRALFRAADRTLTRSDYEKLLATAVCRGQTRLALVLETLCATGIRVSELSAITVEAARRGQATLSLKGKVRTILLTRRLCKKLLAYARQQKTACGEIFLTASGRLLSRKQIWAEMKTLAHHAGIDPRKVFPHNLRHLFASVFYKTTKDIVKLADVLGHSSIETTRLYLIATSHEHAQLLETLHLVT